jgi:hypothetical protein
MAKVTFNIRNVLCGDGGNGFVHLVDMIFDKINREELDTISSRSLSRFCDN